MFEKGDMKNIKLKFAFSTWYLFPIVGKNRSNNEGYFIWLFFAVVVQYKEEEE